MTSLLRLLRYARPYRGRTAIALLAMAVYAVGSAYTAWLIKDVLDSLNEGHVQAVALVGSQVVLAYFLKGVGSYGSTFLMADVGQRVVRDLRNALHRHILGQSAAFFSGRSSGQLVSLITNDVNQVQTTVSETLADLARESLAVVGFAGLLFVLDWRLALVVLVAAPLVVYPLVRLGQRVRRTTRRGQQDLEAVTHLAMESFAGHRIVKAFGAEGRESTRFAAATERLYHTSLRITASLAGLPPLMEFIGGIAAVGALWYGTSRVNEGSLTGGEFGAFLAAAFMMYQPVKKLSRVNASIQQAIAASERIFGMLDTHTEVHEKPGALVLPRMQRSVEFRDVGFAYGDRPDGFALQHASFVVRGGQVVALVGLSGAGKTTLVNLIPRFYDVIEGAILIDGIDIRDVTLASLRGQIALVTQETVLFDDTVAANIAYGRPEAPRAAVEAAARAAHAHEFIQQLPDGYEARIGERGQRLSGGQRQRLAIARAILKDCPLLILDEATSSLDAESELLVQDALANLMRSRTTFVIAHRLSTVRRADLILVIEGGFIVESGTHEKLVARDGGVYAKLHALQTFDDADRVVVSDVR
ncbi:MAG: ATP-binding cassette domain-containing protein [Acidobacteria bacterium]|nr:ATP-binding cassette domain-containing protein [Acidobacteriota bacterium]